MTEQNRNGHSKTKPEQKMKPPLDLTGQIEHDVRKQGYAWSSFLRSWQLFLSADEILVLSGLFNIWSLAFKKNRKQYARRRANKRQSFTLENVPLWEFDGQTNTFHKTIYSSLTLPFFWCAINRLREENNLTKRREDYVLRKLKQKHIVHWYMLTKPYNRRYLHVSTIQLDHYLRAVHHRQDNDPEAEPGKVYVQWSSNMTPT